MAAGTDKNLQLPRKKAASVNAHQGPNIAS
jgi:hypothetical protein